MKKHFTGIALFVFIVGISGFVASLFVEIPKPEVFEIQTVVPKYEGEKKCSKNYRHHEESDVQMIQAFYNEKTKRIFIEFSIEDASVSESNGLQLHFFLKDAGKVRFLSTEKVSLRSADEFEVNLYQRGYFMFDSLKKLGSHQNIYVIAKTYSPVQKGQLLYKNPEFDESKATAVLVADY